MTWQVFPVQELEFRGKPHRLLEIEADSPDEFDAAIEKTLTKGWEIYACGTRPDQPAVQVALFVKPV